MHNDSFNFFSVKKIFLFRFWAFNIVAQHGGVSGHFRSLWRMIWGRYARVPHMEALWLTFVENIESANKHFRQIRYTEALHVKSSRRPLVSIASFVFPISYVTTGCWSSFWVRTENAAKAGKANFERYFVAKKQETRGDNCSNLTLLLLGSHKKC